VPPGGVCYAPPSMQSPRRGTVIPLPGRTPAPAPLWTRVGFAFTMALAFLILAGAALYAAVAVAFPSSRPRSGVPGNIAASVGLMILAMLLVLGAIAVPLVVRRKAQARIDSTISR
jgi:hypothetical protein